MFIELSALLIYRSNVWHFLGGGSGNMIHLGWPEWACTILLCFALIMTQAANIRHRVLLSLISVFSFYVIFKLIERALA